MKIQSKKQIFLYSLIGGVVICAVSTGIALVWSYNSWLWQIMVAMVAGVSFVCGFIISLITCMISIKYGKMAAYLFSGLILLVAVFSLLLGYF